LCLLTDFYYNILIQHNGMDHIKKFSEMFAPIYPTQRRHNSEDRSHQTHHTEELKYRTQFKEQTRWCLAWNIHVTGQPFIGCPWLLVHYVRRKMETDWRRLAMVQLTTAHHLTWILKIVGEFKNDVSYYVFNEINGTPLRENVNRFRHWKFLKFFHVAAPAEKDQIPLLHVT